MEKENGKEGDLGDEENGEKVENAIRVEKP